MELKDIVLIKKRKGYLVFLCLILIVLMSWSFISSSQEQLSASINIEGIWEGKLIVPGGELKIVFNISSENDILTATMDSPNQGVTGIPVEKVNFSNHKVVLEVKLILGVFEGELNKDSMQIEGEWRQGGSSFPLFLKKVEKKVEIVRPQEPTPPFPYQVEEVFFENHQAKIKLAGTLTLPEGKGPFPAVVLISGSGPQDRDETVFGHRPFLVLADYLTRLGIAVLRFDDRGVGKSQGDFSTATSKDFSSDVLTGIEFLKQREEINNHQIGLIGHSEGGIIAPMVAVQSADVAFIVLMAGTGLTGEEIIYLQQTLISRAEGVSEEKIKRDRQYNEKIFSVIKSEQDNKIKEEKILQIMTDYWEDLSAEEKTKFGDLEVYSKSQVGSFLSPWLRFFLIYDPKPTLNQVKCPVLAINGELDLQVPPKENLSAIEEALKKGQNKNYTIQELPNLNHLFQTAQTGSPSEYGKIEETISPLALKTIGDWILKILGLSN